VAEAPLDGGARIAERRGGGRRGARTKGGEGGIDLHLVLAALQGYGYGYG
jgi:hypothetical protein